MKMKIFAWGNLVFFIATLVINYLANSIPIGGRDTGQLSDMFPSLFVPAGFTFSIWGVIYILLLGFIIWQLVESYKKKPLGVTKAIGPRFIISCVANIAWIFAWHYVQIGLSLFIMIGILLSLIIINQKVKIGQKRGTWREKFLVQVPFSVYLGWISVATIANVSIFLLHNNWGMRGMSDVFRTVIVIIVAMLLGLLQLYKNSNIPYVLVLLWSFYGIYSKRISVDAIYAEDIILTLGICSLVLLLACGIKAPQWLKQ